MELVIDTPDFNYLGYAGAIISQITYTFDVDTQSELYKFMKSRLIYAPCRIIISINE
jgi:hypothetical protein